MKTVYYALEEVTIGGKKFRSGSRLPDGPDYQALIDLEKVYFRTIFDPISSTLASSILTDEVEIPLIKTKVTRKKRGQKRRN